jgi:hypothetical protein
MKIRQKFKWGAKFVVNNGESTLFWEGVWIGEIPLKLSLPRLYEHSRDKRCLVSDCREGVSGLWTSNALSVRLKLTNGRSFWKWWNEYK